MEDRTLLVGTVLLDGLEFSATFARSGQSYTSQGTVLLGYAPTRSEPFNPLLSTDGLVTVPINPTATSFTIGPAAGTASASLGLDSLGADPTFWTTSSTTTFDAGALTSTGQALDPAGALPITVADVPFDATNVALAIPSGASTSQAEVLLQGNLDFSSLGLEGLDVGVGTGGDGNDVVVSSGPSSAITLTGVEASVGASFSAFGVAIAGDITASYATSGNNFSFGGSVHFNADGMVNVSASLGGTAVAAGIVQAINLGPSGSFQLFGLTIDPQGLKFQYTSSTQQFAMYGAVTVTVSGIDSITATMGDAADPGLIVDPLTGDISAVNMAISGTFSAFGLGIESPGTNPAALVYSAATGEYEISGTVSVPNLFDATVTLGSSSQPGLTIIGGNWSLNALQISLSDVPLGAFEIQELVVTYTQTSNTDATVAVTLALVFPQDWTVDGSIQLVIDESTGYFDIQNITVTYQAADVDSAIPIGDTGMFLTEMSATVQNFNQPSNLIVSGTMEAVFGQTVTIFGETAAFFQVNGSFSVDKDELTMSAKVYFGALTSGNSTTAILGTGSATMVLDWDDDNYSLDASASLLDGTFTYDATFQFDDGDNILLSATANVNVPHGIPLIGGQSLGSVSFLFEYERPSTEGGQANGFIAAWTKVDLLVTTVEIGIEYNYVKDSVETIGTGTINNLKNNVNTSSDTYTYSQSFTVPSGATQGTLEVDWTDNSVLAAVNMPPPTLTVEGTGIANVTVTSSTTGDITLLQNTDLTNSTQQIVGLVGSTSDPYTALAVTPGGSYTLQATFTSTQEPTNTSIGISSITDDPADGGVLVQFEGGSVPGDIEVGDTVSITNAGISSYDTTSSTPLPIVQDITSSGVVLNLTYTSESTGGTLMGWTLPQFNATWDIPPPTIAIGSVSAVSATGTTTVTMPVQVSSTLASDADVDLYMAPYDASLGLNQTDDGTLVANDLTLSGATTNGTLIDYTASTTVDLSQLLPTTYYFYAVVNDGTNTPVTSAFTTLAEVENAPVVSGTVSNQNGGALSGWTVFVDLNKDGTDDPGDPSTTTNSSGFYGFYLSQIPADTPVDIDLVNLDPTAYVFGTPASGINTVTYMGSPLDANFIAAQLSTIEGTVFLDQNRTGNSSGQPPLSGWTVFLSTDGSDQLAPGDPTSLTGADGSYSFSNLTPGTTYTVGLALDTGASAIYAFDATAVSGTSAYDIAGDPSSIAQVGTLDGGARVGTPTRFGVPGHDYASTGDQVLKLDGSTGYLSVAGTSQLQPGDSANGDGGFTVGAWVRGDQALLGGGDPTIAGTITSGTASGGWNLGLSSSLSFSNKGISNSAGQSDPVIYTADFNDDGKPDLLSVDGVNGFASVLLNTTTSGATSPTFSSDRYTYGLGGYGLPAEAAIADFNGDGKPDFAVALAEQGEVLVFLNTTPQGSSTPSFTVFTLEDSEGPGAITAVTLSGAGHLPDLVVENVVNGTLTVFMNETTRGSSVLDFAAQTVPLDIPGITFKGNNDSATQFPYEIVTGDFNGDGRPDLAITGDSVPLVVLINTTPADATTASFGTPLVLTPGLDQGPSDLAVGDFNGDGKDDIAYVNAGYGQTFADTLYVLMSTTPRNSGAPSFSRQDFVVGTEPAAVLVTDLNADGRPDIAVSNNFAGSVTILLNTTATDAAAATFSAQTFEALPRPTLMITGDFNGDGRTDLAVDSVSSGDESASIAILQNNTLAGSSTPEFTASIENNTFFDTDSPTVNMVAADFLGNGLIDLASTALYVGSINIATNTTRSSLTAEVEENPASGSGEFSIASPSITVLDSNTWYYVAFTYAPNVDSAGDDQLTLYVNGQMVAQSTGTGSLPSNPDISGSSTFDLLIGAEPGTNVSSFFSGYLDDVSIWPEAFTEQEIQALYGGGMSDLYVQTAPSDPSTYTAAIPNTTTLVQGDSFGAFNAAAITGTIMGAPLDSSTSEPLSGWTVELLDSRNDVIATTETGSDGLYFFFNVLPGTYTIEQVLQDGWEQSTPSGGAGITVTAAEGTEYTGEDFANTQVAQVTGTVYIDANNNGIQDPGELLASGITVNLDPVSDGTLGAGDPSTVTLADGVFSFTGLAPGRYIVGVSAAAVGVTTQPSPAFYPVDVTARGSVSGLAFGLSPLVLAPIASVTQAEGSPVSFSVALSHAETGQPATFYLVPGAPAGATIDPSTGVFAWTPLTPGDYTVTVSAVAAGTPILSDSQTFTVVVTDVAPVVQLGPNGSIAQGQLFTALGSFTDPGTDPWTATVNYGDGSSPQPLLLGLNMAFELDHIYVNPGAYQVTVIVNDGEGGTGAASMMVMVVPSAPPPPVVPLSSGFGVGRDAFVSTFYNEAFGYGPDQASLSYWSGLLRAGASSLAVARKIWDAPAHRAREHEQGDAPIGFRAAYRRALRAGTSADRRSGAAHAASFRAE
jgi:hypothetical protein